MRVRPSPASIVVTAGPCEHGRRRGSCPCVRPRRPRCPARPSDRRPCPRPRPAPHPPPRPARGSPRGRATAGLPRARGRRSPSHLPPLRRVRCRWRATRARARAGVTSRNRSCVPLVPVAVRQLYAGTNPELPGGAGTCDDQAATAATCQPVRYLASVKPAGSRPRHGRGGVACGARRRSKGTWACSVDAQKASGVDRRRMYPRPFGRPVEN